jgi:hypothetical protein
VFPPTSFIHLAHQLVTSGAGEPPSSPEMTAARVGTALGRSYYAVYLLVRAEISRRHGISPRHLQHGTVYTRLQSPMASDDVRRLGRNLEWMYTLRQKADYELDPDPVWRGHLQDVEGAAAIAQTALELARTIPQLDFSPVAALLDPRG